MGSVGVGMSMYIFVDRMHPFLLLCSAPSELYWLSLGTKLSLNFFTSMSRVLFLSLCQVCFVVGFFFKST